VSAFTVDFLGQWGIPTLPRGLPPDPVPLLQVAGIPPDAITGQFAIESVDLQ